MKKRKSDHLSSSPQNQKKPFLPPKLHSNKRKLHSLFNHCTLSYKKRKITPHNPWKQRFAWVLRELRQKHHYLQQIQQLTQLLQQKTQLHTELVQYVLDLKAKLFFKPVYKCIDLSHHRSGIACF